MGRHSSDRLCGCPPFQYTGTRNPPLSDAPVCPVPDFRLGYTVGCNMCLKYVLFFSSFFGADDNKSRRIALLLDRVPLEIGSHRVWPNGSNVDRCRGHVCNLEPMAKQGVAASHRNFSRPPPRAAGQLSLPPSLCCLGVGRDEKEKKR